MAGFFNSYIDELLDYSAVKVQQKPNHHDTIATHFALLQLNKYLKITNKNTDFIGVLENTAKLNNPFSLFLLGMLKLDGLGIVAREPLAGYSLIAVAALKECYWALNAMGAFHMQGNSFVVKDFAEAKKNFAKALATVPNDRRTLRNIGFCCLHRSEHAEAIHYLKLAQKQDDNTLDSIWHLLKANKQTSKVINFYNPIMQERTKIDNVALHVQNRLPH